MIVERKLSEKCIATMLENSYNSSYHKGEWGIYSDPCTNGEMNDICG